MRNITMILVGSLALFFTACGGGNNDRSGNTGTIDNESPNTHGEPTGKTMQKDTPYYMQAGITIVKTQDDTIIELETDIESGMTTAKLLEGGAKIE